MPTRSSSASHWGHFSVEVRDGRVVGLDPSPADPDPSPILDSIPGTLDHPTRIAQPMIRSGWLERGPGRANSGRGADPYVPVAWDRALDLLAAELGRVRRDYGNEGIFAGSYGWASAGRFHHAQGQVHRFLNLFGGYTYSVDTYSTAALTVLLPHILGRKEAIWAQSTSWPVIEEHAELVIMFGGIALKNGQVNPGGSGQHLVRQALKRCRANGIEFVNLSPVRDDAAEFLQARWLPLRPSSDTAVMLGIAHTLLTEERHDRAFIERYCVGFERLRSYVLGESDGQPKTPEWAQAISEVRAGDIRQLARDMADKRTFITLSWSVQRTHHGEQPYWMATALAAMLGQIGLPGGGVGFGYGAVGGIGNATRDLPLPTLPQGDNPVASHIPVARISDLLLEPGSTIDYNGRRLTLPRTGLVYWCGGNPFHHHQDLNRLLRAWRRPDTIVIQDPYWTPAARHADIVLPVTTALERNDIAAARLDAHMVAMRKAVEPIGQARNDHDILAGLAARLGFAERFTEGRDEMGWLEHLYEVARQQVAAHRIEMPAFEEFWSRGSYRFPEPERPLVLFEGFRADPEAHPLPTPSGRIELFSERIASFGYADCPGHPVWLEPDEWLGSSLTERYPLHLVSNQPRTRLHSQLDQGVTSRRSKVNGREPVRINPHDASARGVRDGDVVRIFNERGACLAGAVLSDGVRPGVIELATGAWYDPLEPGRIGTLCVHGNPNVLTPDVGTSKLAQGPSAHSALVEVELWDRALPPIRVFDPPPTVSS